MSEEEIAQVTSTAQAAVLLNLILRMVFAQAMAMLFSSIIMVQILAHLPLADVMLPANALEVFDIMIGIVSFDYFQPTEYFDFGFSEMPPWSTNFEWLGYGSISFVDGMGSILVFAIIQILTFLIVIFVVTMKIRCHRKCQSAFSV